MTTEITTEINVPAVKKMRAKKEYKLSAKARKAVAAYENEELEIEEGGGKIANILALYVAGVPRGYIINELGFNKTTVHIQCGQFDKLRKAPALEFHGYELFEVRVQKYMKAKKCTREVAVEALIEKDTNG